MAKVYEVRVSTDGGRTYRHFEAQASCLRVAINDVLRPDIYRTAKRLAVYGFATDKEPTTSVQLVAFGPVEPGSRRCLIDGTPKAILASSWRHVQLSQAEAACRAWAATLDATEPAGFVLEGLAVLGKNGGVKWTGSK